MTHRIRLGAFGLAAIVMAACSSESTAPLGAGSAAASAADQFTKLADSVHRSGGDTDIVNAYAAIAGAVRASGHVSSIVITIDGAATTFTATAIANELSYGGAPCFANGCAAPKPILSRALVAWDAANPKRLVQLASESDDLPIGAVLNPTLLASYVPTASLMYMDGKGGIYFGTSGSQKISETRSTTPCVVSRDSVASKLPSTCTQSEFDISFSAKAEPSLFQVPNSTATGVHTIAMSAQTVAGSHVLTTIPTCDTVCVPWGPNSPPPPVVVRPSQGLPSSITTSVDSLLNMTLTVKNPSAQPIKISFSSGQKFDFVVTDSSTGRDVWRWSANKSFPAVVSEQEIPANGSIAFTADWKPPTPGLYLVHGLLVSTSHRSEAYGSVLVR